MAKRKAKKSMTGLIMICVACILGLAAIFMMFLPAVASKEPVLGKELSFTGVQTAFGYTEVTKIPVVGTEVKTDILKANVLAALAYLLPIAGIVLAVLFRKSRLFGFVSAAAFIVSGVFAFLMLTTFPATVIGNQYLSLEYTLQIGAILSGIFSVLAGAAMLCKIVLKK